MAIAQSLKRFRQNFNLSQKAVADALGIKQQSYSQYEFNFKGKPVTPSIDVVAKIAKAYNVSIDYLAGLIDNPRPLNQEPKTITSPDESGEYATRSELADLRNALAAKGII